MEPKTQLLAQVSSSQNRFKANDSIPLEVRVINNGKKSVELPVMLECGYDSAMNRNFFFQVADTAGKLFPESDIRAADYNRIYSVPDNQRHKSLAPGHELTAKENINEWYHLRPGTYKIRMVFDPSPEETGMSGSSFPVYSEWISISILE